MKKKHLSLAFGLLLSLVMAVQAGAVDYFSVSLPSSGQAGDNLTITIAAFTNEIQDPSYTGLVTLTATSGAGTISPGTISITSGGMVTSSIKFYAAGSITVTCREAGGAIGTAQCTIGHLGATNMLAVFPGQIYTPGLGVTPVTPTVQEGVAQPVTVYVVDQFYNVVTDYVGGDVELIGSPNYTIFPAHVVTPVNGKAYYTISFSFSGPLSVDASSPYGRSFPVRVLSTTQAYLHLQVPTSVVAGSPFTVNAFASSSATDPLLVLASTNGMTFKINRYVAGTSNPATGTWGETEYFQIGPPNPDGKYSGFFTYTRAEAIYLNAEKFSTLGIPVTGINSIAIDVLPNLPAGIQVSISPAQIESKHQARISALAVDTYGNPTRSSMYPFVVQFEQTAGNGLLSLTQTATDQYGFAYCDYTGGNFNETAQIKITLYNPQLGITYAEATQAVQISVAPPGENTMVNYPNPFNPGTQKTSVNYFLKGDSEIEIRIYDAFGRMVLSKDLKPGEGSGNYANATRAQGANFLWDGKNAEGQTVANGIYLVKVTARNSVAVQNFTRRVGVVK